MFHLAPQHRLYACYFLLSFMSGAVYSRLPDIQATLGVNEAQLGLTLIGTAFGALISLTFSSPLIEKLGARTTAYITSIGCAVLYTAVGFVNSAPLAFLALFATGLLSGALEINLNVEVGRLEVATGRSLMSRAHGFWSVGFFVTSLAAVAIRQAAIPVAWHLTAIFVIELVVVAIAVPGIANAPVAPTEAQEKPPLIAAPSMALLPLCFIAIAAFLVEGAGVDWSGIYMRDAFAAPPFMGALALTLFTFFMSMMRLFAGPVVDRTSPRAVALVLLAISTAGLCLVWLSPHPVVALIGFAMLGGGCSAIYPLVVSAAAQRTDRPSAINIAALGQVSFVIFFLAPPLLGAVANAFGIRWSYVVCLPLVILALFMVRALPARPVPEPLGESLPEPLTPNG